MKVKILYQKTHDDLTEDCDSSKRSSKLQTKDLRQLTKTTDTLQKSKFVDQLRIDEIEQYNRRQNLELQGGTSWKRKGCDTNHT